MSHAVAVAIAALLLAVSLGADAQDPAADYPQKTVRIVVGFTPGGGPDITARILSDADTARRWSPIGIEPAPTSPDP